MIWVLTHHNISRSTQCVGLEIKAFASCYIDGFEIHKFKRMEGPAFPHQTHVHLCIYVERRAQKP